MSDSKSKSTEKQKEEGQKTINEEIIDESLYKLLKILKGLEIEAERKLALEEAEGNES